MKRQTPPCHLESDPDERHPVVRLVSPEHASFAMATLSPDVAGHHRRAM